MKPISLLIVITILLFSSCSANESTNGLIIKQSPHNFKTTYNKLKTIISNNPNLKILLELDHSNNAASVGLKLRPTKIILFGNPKLGTPLMQAQQTAGIDLPQKIIVYQEEDNTVNIAYNNPTYLENRHKISGKDVIIDKIINALNKITDAVIKAE